MASKTKRIKISLVIVHTLLRQGIHSLLNDLDYFVLSSYDNGKEMTRNFPTEGLPDVVLMDVDREKSAALEAVRWIRAHHPSVKILALCLEAEESVMQPLLDNGAHGYVCKAAAPRELNAAIKTVVEKGTYLPPLDPWRLRRC